MLASLLLCVSACGGDQEPPTAPSGPRQPTLAIAGVPASLTVGESRLLRAVVVTSDGSGAPPPTEVVWRSSNDAVVSVGPGGVLVAVSPGSATITAAAGDLTTSVALSAVAAPTGLRASRDASSTSRPTRRWPA